MNRLFLIVYIVVLVISIASFLLKRKRIPGKQKIVMYILYGFTVIFLILLQLQQKRQIPIDDYLNVFSPHIKSWIDHVK